MAKAQLDRRSAAAADVRAMLMAQTHTWDHHLAADLSLPEYCLRPRKVYALQDAVANGGLPMRRIPIPVLILLAAAAMALGFVLAGPKPLKDERPAETPPS
ncbi:MAG TPA: hypothetical protein VGC23_04205 [Vicinamibacterales bacterium]